MNEQKKQLKLNAVRVLLNLTLKWIEIAPPYNIIYLHRSKVLSSTFQNAFGSRKFGLHETSCCS